MPRDDYYQKQAARAERLSAAAERARQKSAAAYKRADMREEVSGIPFGQPVLVGHHSEKRHRAAIARADNAMRTSIAEDKKANELDSRAEAVGTGGISSDAPDAVELLTAKIDKAKADQEFMKGANRAIRACWKAGIRHDGPAEDIAKLIKALKKATGKDIGEAAARAMMQKDFAGRIGFADYQLTNNNANIKRMEARLKQLESVAKLETKTLHETNSLKVVQNTEANRVQIIFDGKPPAEVRAILKGRGFRWAPSEGAWQRMLNNAGIWNGQQAAKEIAELG